ncbi:phage portal protein [Dyadobacter flavalbus]|uniref:Phage portal protein n=1 Tax=Dyadobacter flavalbus TaxID=2579942 RepID=A0A5M8QYR8_9BACT|nr:phage portal protein [Dyadobacter flavalbus]KAA6441445.1 phage portal protein [Dyadobacter flavalbus]
MNLQELTQLLGQEQDITTKLKKLRGRNKISEETEKLTALYDIEKHDIYDTVKRPDRIVMKEDDEGNMVYDRKELVNRIALPFQKLIVKRAVSFVFGNPVILQCETETDQEEQVLEAVKRILHENKSNGFDRRIARELFKTTQVAECWFPVAKSESHEDYGFPTQFKIRVTSFNTSDGNKLYPLFDETGDMIAFSREFTIEDDEDKKKTYFETYTAEEKRTWIQDGNVWTEQPAVPNTIGKIPIVYASQEQVEWEDVQSKIDRLEKLLSNFAETNDYHASPKIFVEGNITGWAKKGEQGAIIQGEPGTKAYYLSWDQAPESVRLEIETLLRFIFSFTQTPDISFDSVKGLREISGEALKMLFLDAHLKVQDKREIFDDYLQRRISILKAFVGTMNLALKPVASKLLIEPEIQPFIINDQKAMIERLTMANGNKAIVSQKTSIALSGLVDDVDAELKQIQAEEKERAANDTFETAF